MGKKRDRDDDGDTVQDHGAESLLFEIVPSAEDTSSSSKRSKSSSSAEPAQPVVQESGGDADGDTTAGTKRTKYHPAAIAPSSALRQCDGFDVVRKGSRGRGRQLMVLPGALGLGNGGSGGRLGTLNSTTPSHPVLYVEFPEGRLKCTGRTVHPKGRLFTLYADKAAGRATRMDCRDVFDSVVIFGKACWVGKKEDNPSEDPLPLPESLQCLREEDEEASGSGDEDGGGSRGGATKLTAADFKTHFGGGNPESLMSGDAKSNASAGEGAGTADGGGDGEEGGGSGGQDGEGEGQSPGTGGEKAPARRVSSRSTKSTVTYVEDSGDELDDGDKGSSSGGSDDEGDSGGGGAGGENADEDVVVVEGNSSSNKNGVRGGSSSDGGSGNARDGVEVFSILDAPATAKRKPVTIGSGRDKKATVTPRGGKQAAANPKGKGRRRTLASSESSSSGNEDNGKRAGEEDEDSGEESPAWGEDVAAAAAGPEPSRRSSRASAVSRVKYTQSSSSEEEEEEGEREIEDDDDDEFEP